MADVQGGRDEQSLGQLFASASQDLSALVRSEVELAKAEIRQDVRNGAVGAGMFGAAVFFLLLSAVIGSIALALGLRALGITTGWAFLIVAGVYLLLALILVLIGRSAVRRIRPPERTIRTTKANVALLKNSGTARNG
jgi:ABC-type multidrug transport system fused ATPase/permease subunit